MLETVVKPLVWKNVCGEAAQWYDYSQAYSPFLFEAWAGTSYQTHHKSWLMLWFCVRNRGSSSGSTFLGVMTFVEFSVYFQEHAPKLQVLIVCLQQNWLFCHFIYVVTKVFPHLTTAVPWQWQLSAQCINPLCFFVFYALHWQLLRLWISNLKNTRIFQM